MKQDLIKLKDLIESVRKIWNDDMITSAGVVIQNMLHEVNEDSDYDKYTPYLSILRQMKDFKGNHHVFNWIYDETSMIVYGYFMSKEEYNIPEEPEYALVPFDYEYFYQNPTVELVDRGFREVTFEGRNDEINIYKLYFSSSYCGYRTTLNGRYFDNQEHECDVFMKIKK